MRAVQQSSFGCSSGRADRESVLAAESVPASGGGPVQTRKSGDLVHIAAAARIGAPGEVLCTGSGEDAAAPGP